jgi:hypothetical protein
LKNAKPKTQNPKSDENPKMAEKGTLNPKLPENPKPYETLNPKFLETLNFWKS